jgi:hypothetical protein
VVGEIDGLASPAALPAAAPLEMEELSAGLTELALLLEKDLSAAELLLDRLRAGVAGSEREEAVGEIAAQVDVFAIDEALVQVKALQSQLEAKA